MTDLWQAYETFYIPPLEQLSIEHHTLFLRTKEIAGSVPKNHWYDYFHFTNPGAQTFSEWLGGALAEHRDLFQ